MSDFEGEHSVGVRSLLSLLGVREGRELRGSFSFALGPRDLFVLGLKQGDRELLFECQWPHEGEVELVRVLAVKLR
jgi:hypothetical protein